MEVSGVVFRPAVRQDAWAIRRLIWKVRINPVGLDWRHFLVAVDEKGSLLGCGQLKPHGDGSLELASIAVQPEQRHRGIASAVIERLVVKARRPLYLICAPSNKGFYERFSFHAIGLDEMPPSFRRESQAVEWYSSLVMRGKPLMYVMRLD